MMDNPTTFQRVMREEAHKARVASRYEDLVSDAHRLMNDRDRDSYKELVETFMLYHWSEREFQLWFTCPTSWLNFGIPICLWDSGDPEKMERVRVAAYRTATSREGSAR